MRELLPDAAARRGTAALPNRGTAAAHARPAHARPCRPSRHSAAHTALHFQHLAQVHIVAQALHISASCNFLPPALPFCCPAPAPASAGYAGRAPAEDRAEKDPRVQQHQLLGAEHLRADVDQLQADVARERLRAFRMRAHLQTRLELSFQASRACPPISPARAHAERLPTHRAARRTPNPRHGLFSLLLLRGAPGLPPPRERQQTQVHRRVHRTLSETGWLIEPLIE